LVVIVNILGRHFNMNIKSLGRMISHRIKYYHIYVNLGLKLIERWVNHRDSLSGLLRGKKCLFCHSDKTRSKYIAYEWCQEMESCTFSMKSKQLAGCIDFKRWSRHEKVGLAKTDGIG
ncbi:unnamed protein product, partial [Owenia fusiformis]